LKRTFMLVAAAVVALTAAGYAVAHGFDGAKTVKAVTGTFTATTASRVETRTCTTSDGKTLVITNGKYTGTSSGDADLTGPATLEARSTINTTDAVGVVSGALRIDTASGEDAKARFDAVYQSGHIAGLASGYAHEDPRVKLLANLSADFTAAGGFANGKLGGTTGGAAVELGPGKCERSQKVKENTQASGTVTAVSSTSITVAGLTCAVPADLQSVVAGLTVGARAEIRCSLVNGVNTLVKGSGKKR
jgi:hypothetical protein